MIGHLVARNEPAAVLAQRIGIERCTGMRHDKGDDRLTPLAGRRADNSGLCDAGILQQEALDLGRRNVDAAALDDFGVAADETEVALRVEKTEIAGSEIAFRGESGGIV